MRALTVAAAVLGLIPGLTAPAGAAEVTKQITVEIPATAAPRFVIENLAGVMTIVPGTGGAVVAVATVHAGNDDLLGRVRFEKVTSDLDEDDTGLPTWRVRYPLDRESIIYYPGSHREDGSIVGKLLGGSRTNTRYDGRRVTVSGRSGPLLYADVEVRVPRREIEATFRNVVGALKATGLQGRVRLESGSGDVAVERSKGTLTADTGSGDIRGSDLEGSFRCDTGSGDCAVINFRGETIDCNTGSGDVKVEGASARSFSADTGSGDVRVADADLEEFDADAGSGNVTLRARSAARLQRVRADTGSGDVVLTLGPEASFEALVDQGSGDIINRYSDARPIVRDKTVVGYRRGDARIRIDIDTGSGDLTLDPGGAAGGQERMSTVTIEFQ